jgi:hypothetical protein
MLGIGQKMLETSGRERFSRGCVGRFGQTAANDPWSFDV